MPSLPLHEAVDQETRYANFLIQTANELGRDAVGGEVYNQLSEQYRKIGVSFLLLDADLDAFAHSLIDSAITRRELLRRPPPPEPDHAWRTSFLGPVHDAIAVGQFGLAAEIGRLSPDTWFEDFEFEEDFLYGQLLFRLIDPERTDDVEALLDHHEAALRGIDDPRNAVCRALVARDAVGFVEAFGDFAEQTEAAIEEARTTSYQFYEFEEVSIEGLALLRLADRGGLPTEREYRHCPSWGRRDDYAPYVSQSFPGVPLDG